MPYKKSDLDIDIASINLDFEKHGIDRRYESLHFGGKSVVNDARWGRRIASGTARECAAELYRDAYFATMIHLDGGKK